MSNNVGTGRHLTSSELRLWTSFVDSSRILETELELQLVNDFGMTHREYEVLVRIDGHGGQLRMSVLARQIEASAALITQTVGRLVDRGWIERKPSLGDRRGVEAALTPLGRERLAAAAKPHAELIRQLLLAPLDAGDLDALAGLFGQVADHLRLHRSGATCDDPDCPIA